MKYLYQIKTISDYKLLPRDRLMNYVSMFSNVAITCSGLTSPTNGMISFSPLPAPYSFGTMASLELTIQ